jgi:hypothetical protein
VAGASTVAPPPEVAFVDPNFGFFTNQFETDEHPPTDIQRGQAFLDMLLTENNNFDR